MSLRRSTGPFRDADFAPRIVDALGRPWPEGADGERRWARVMRAHEARISGGFHRDLDRFGEIAGPDESRELDHRLPHSRPILGDRQDVPSERQLERSPYAMSHELLEEADGRHHSWWQRALARHSRARARDLAERLAVLGCADHGDELDRRVGPAVSPFGGSPDDAWR